ncbi:Hypothetical predicted protein [Paramuricea clavata]|uniref:Uncharacterized protein n=1 Tax=Paramuricea clavata TaxID=317549 RepID=A0A7D9JVS2_PARCT|nr:Hypothetical predicted protein [Paramuricea clavata]
MYEQGPMIFLFVCREITLTASCFDGKRQLLDSLRSNFPGGTMNLESHGSNSIILTYWQSLLEDYRNVFNKKDDATARVVNSTSHFGHQNIPNSNYYWFLEPGNSMSTLSEADVEKFVAELSSTDEDKEQICPTEMSDHKNQDENHRSETCGKTNERKLSEHVLDVAGKDETEVDRKHSMSEPQSDYK